MSLPKDNLTVETRDPLVVFLYLLMRDEVVPGRVEHLVREALSAVENPSVIKPLPTRFSNGWLAMYAYDLRVRLVPSCPSK